MGRGNSLIIIFFCCFVVKGLWVGFEIFLFGYIWFFKISFLYFFYILSNNDLDYVKYFGFRGLVGLVKVRKNRRILEFVDFMRSKIVFVFYLY